MNRTISTVGLVAAFAVGCGSSLPPARVASTETAVQSAREAGAERVPQADQHLKMAEDNLARAKTLNAKKDGDKAEAMLRRASADAALAAALTDEAKQTKAATGKGTP